MTIGTTVEAFDSARAHGFQYVHDPDVAVVSVVAQRDAPATPLTGLLQACVAVVRPRLEMWLAQLPQHRAYVFVSTPRSLQVNALARRRGAWGEELRWLSADAQRSPSVELSGTSGVRFLGLSEVPMTSIGAAAEFARTHQSSVLFLSNNGDLSEARVRRMASLVFPKEDDVANWSSLTGALHEREDILLRVQGGFDDREVSVDALLSAEMRRTIDR